MKIGNFPIEIAGFLTSFGYVAQLILKIRKTNSDLILEVFKGD